MTQGKYTVRISFHEFDAVEVESDWQMAIFDGVLKVYGTASSDWKFKLFPINVITEVTVREN